MSDLKLLELCLLKFKSKQLLLDNRMQRCKIDNIHFLIVSKVCKMHQSQFFLSILIIDERFTCSTIKTVYCRSCFCKNGWINWRNIFKWDCLSRYGTIIATRCRGWQSVGVQKPPESTGEQLNVWSNVFLDPRFAWVSLDASVKPAKMQQTESECEAMYTCLFINNN